MSECENGEATTVSASECVDRARGQPLARLLPAALLAAVCFLVAYSRPFGTSRDFSEYQDFFDDLRLGGLGLLETSRFEPLFIVLSYVTSLAITTSPALYATLAAMSLALKASVLSALSSSHRWLIYGLALYAFRFAPLHELTQLRASTALAVLMLAFWLRWNGRLPACVLACLCAAGLHYSATFLVPFVLLKTVTRKRLLLLTLLQAAVVAGTLQIVIALFSDSLKVLAMYDQNFFETPRLLSGATVLDLFMVGTALFMWDDLPGPAKHCVALQVAGWTFFYAGLGFPAFAVRLREAFAVFWVVFVVQAGHFSPRLRIATFVFVWLGVVLYVYWYFLNPVEVYFQ
jgi:hypothetical protein